MEDEDIEFQIDSFAAMAKQIAHLSKLVVCYRRCLKMIKSHDGVCPGCKPPEERHKHVTEMAGLALTKGVDAHEH